MRKKLKEVRLMKNLTHSDMAEYIGLVRTSYTNIEIGIKNPSERVASRIKEILENNDDDLLFNEPNQDLIE